MSNVEIKKTYLRECKICKTKKLNTEFNYRSTICKICSLQKENEKKLKEQKEKEYRDSLPGEYVICQFCKKEFMFLSGAHIEWCSKYTMNYNQYVEKFGRDAVWSTKYSLQQIKNSQEAGSRPEVKQKITEGLQKYFENNKEEVLQRTENMRNSPNRLPNLLEHYKNMPDEEKQLRSDAAIKSWERPSTRNARIKGLQSDKAKAARKANMQICLATEQPVISQPARDLFEALKSAGFNVELEYFLGFFHLDIAILEYKIDIEADGDFWHGNMNFYRTKDSIDDGRIVLLQRQIDRKNNDIRKNTYLTNRGWTILRFWQSELEAEDGLGHQRVIDAINKIIAEKKQYGSTETGTNNN